MLPLVVLGCVVELSSAFTERPEKIAKVSRAKISAVELIHFDIIGVSQVRILVRPGHLSNEKSFAVLVRSAAPAILERRKKTPRIEVRGGEAFISASETAN